MPSNPPSRAGLRLLLVAGIGAALLLACGGGASTSHGPASSTERLGPAGTPSACFIPGDGLPADWPVVVVPDGADVCRSDRTWLQLAMFDDAEPPLRQRMDALLASTPGIEATGRRSGSRAIYRAGDLEFIVDGYVGEDSDHAGMQTEVTLLRCGERLGTGDITCQD